MANRLSCAASAALVMVLLSAFAQAASACPFNKPHFSKWINGVNVYTDDNFVGHWTHVVMWNGGGQGMWYQVYEPDGSMWEYGVGGWATTHPAWVGGDWDLDGLPDVEDPKPLNPTDAAWWNGVGDYGNGWKVKSKDGHLFIRGPDGTLYEIGNFEGIGLGIAKGGGAPVAINSAQGNTLLGELAAGTGNPRWLELINWTQDKFNGRLGTGDGNIPTGGPSGWYDGFWGGRGGGGNTSLDTDKDGIPDWKDGDLDGDGGSNRDEETIGSDPEDKDDKVEDYEPGGSKWTLPSTGNEALDAAKQRFFSKLEGLRSQMGEPGKASVSVEFPIGMGSEKYTISSSSTGTFGPSIVKLQSFMHIVLKLALSIFFMINCWRVLRQY